MKLVVVLACLVACCLALKPKPCVSPPLLTGALTVSTQNEKLWVYGKYIYDAVEQQVRIFEIGTYENKSFTFDALLHFREGVIYEINDRERTCKKSPLKADFQPMRIPDDASLLAQSIIGGSSAPGQGLLVNTWEGNLPDNSGKYMSVVTEFGCIPINTNYQTKEFGWVVTSFFNNVIGITDPGLLNPPDFCASAEMDDTAEPKDFAAVFL